VHRAGGSGHIPQALDAANRQHQGQRQYSCKRSAHARADSHILKKIHDVSARMTG
jgi:hypothetical protein